MTHDPDQPLTEAQLHEALENFFANGNEHTAPTYDVTGASGFLIVCFNKYTERGDKLEANSTAEDKLVAMASSTYISLPYVEGNESGALGPQETLRHGIQAVATAMMGTAMQQTVLRAIIQHAQQFMIETRNKTDD